MFNFFKNKDEKLVRVPCISMNPKERAARGDIVWFLLKTECIGEFDAKNGFDDFFLYRTEKARDKALELAEERYESVIKADNVRVPLSDYTRFMLKVNMLQTKVNKIKAEGMY